MTTPTCHCEKPRWKRDKLRDETRLLPRLLNIVGQGSGQAISEIAALTTFARNDNEFVTAAKSFLSLRAEGEAISSFSIFLKKEVGNYVK